MSEHFQQHASVHYSSDREPDSLLEQAYEDRQTGGSDDPDDDYSDEEYEREAWLAELAGAGDPERDFEEEKFNAQLMREE